MVGRTPVEESHWDDAIVQRQHYIYKYRRGFVINKAFEPITGTPAASDLGLVTTDATAFAGLQPQFHIPCAATADAGQTGGYVGTIDDYDADVQWVITVRARATVENGQIRIDYGTTPSSYTFTIAPAASFAWFTGTVNLTKLQAINCIRGYFRTTLAGGTLEWTHLAIRHAEQGTIGV
jgi:hypothetical protein